MALAVMFADDAAAIITPLRHATAAKIRALPERLQACAGLRYIRYFHMRFALCRYSATYVFRHTRYFELAAIDKVCHAIIISIRHR